MKRRPLKKLVSISPGGWTDCWPEMWRLEEITDEIFMEDKIRFDAPADSAYSHFVLTGESWWGSSQGGQIWRTIPGTKSFCWHLPDLTTYLPGPFEAKGKAVHIAGKPGERDGWYFDLFGAEERACGRLQLAEEQDLVNRQLWIRQKIKSFRASCW